MQNDLWHSSFKPIDAKSQRATIISGGSFGLFKTFEVNWLEIHFSPHEIDVLFLPKRAKHTRILRIGGPNEVIILQGWNLLAIGEVKPVTSTTTIHDGVRMTTSEYPSFIVKTGDTIDDRLRRIAESAYSRKIDEYLSEFPQKVVLADFRRFRAQPWIQGHDKKEVVFTTKLPD